MKTNGAKKRNGKRKISAFDFFAFVGVMVVIIGIEWYALSIL